MYWHSDNIMASIFRPLVPAVLVFLAVPALAGTPGSPAPWAGEDGTEGAGEEAAESAEGEEEARGRSIYRVRDASGRVMFTDEPPEDAREVEEMDVRDPQSMPATEVPSRSARPEPEEPEPFRYDRLEITSPEHEENIHNPETVSVSVSLEPSLRPGHELRLFHNGEPVEDTTLEWPIRGEHQVQARVLDGDGNEVQSSDPVTFYIHRASRQIQPGERRR